MKYYLIISGNLLLNIYNTLPPQIVLDSGLIIEEVTSLPPGLRIGQIRVDGQWVDPPPVPPTPVEDWQAFLNKLDVPERGGNGGYALALSSAAKVDAHQAYVLVILFIRRIATDQERLTLAYHLQQVIAAAPDTLPLLIEALQAGNINLPGFEV